MSDLRTITLNHHLGGVGRLTFGSTLAAAVLILGGTSLFENVAVAQEAEDSRVLENIIVTARRREESIQETPLSITAISGDDLLKMNIIDLEDLGRYIPNVMMVEAGQGGGSGLYFIRGIGQQGNADTARPEPGVAFYIDGVYKSRGQGGVRELIDLERVEVLRGPQGTLFGRNAIGGAINIITKRPSDTFYGKGRVTLGSDNTFNVMGKVNAPVTDEFFFSAAASSSNRDGYFTRLNDGKVLSDVNTDSARLAARWLPNDRLDINFVADATRTREAGLAQYLKTVLPEPGLMDWHEMILRNAGLPSYASMSRDVAGFGHHEGYGQANMKQDGDEWGTSLTLEYDWNGKTLTSITAYREIDYISNFDADASTYSFNEQRNLIMDNDQFTQEFRLDGTAFNDKFNWLVGAYYYKDNSYFVFDQELFEEVKPTLDMLPFFTVPPPGLEDFASLCTGAPPLPPPDTEFPFCVFGGAGNPGNGFLILFFSANNTTAGPNLNIAENSAVFMSGTYHFSDKWSLTAGVRYSSEEKQWLTLERLFQDQGGPSGLCEGAGETPPVCTAQSETWDSWTPKVSLEYQASPDHLIYALISRGFKAGGINGNPALPPYEPETVLAYEIGAKTDWLNDRLRLNFAAFYNDYTDLQLEGFFLDPITGDLQRFNANAAEAPIYGFELEMLALSANIFTFQGSLGYLNNEFTNVDPGVIEVTIGTKIPQSPEWNASGAFIFDFPLQSGRLNIRADAFYRSKTYQRLANVEQLAQSGFTMFNARISYEPESTNWQLSLFATNLSDKEYVAYGAGDINTGGLSLVTPGEPRMWGVTADFRF